MSGIDLAALRDYPMSEVQRLHAISIANPYRSFRDFQVHPRAPDDHRRKLTAEDIRGALYRGLDTYDPVEHRVLMLAAISDWIPRQNAFASFFVNDHVVLMDDILAVLDAEGLAEHAAILREAAAAFGPVDMSNSDRFARIHGSGGTGQQTDLKKQLAGLSRQFAALPDPLDIASDRIAASPELTAIYTALHRETGDDTRLGWLAHKLWQHLLQYDDDPSAALADLPDPYDHIAIAYIFNAEMLNGGVGQFLYNSWGALAPELVEALQAMGLPVHAAAVQKGIDQFPSPYPRDTMLRRASFEQRGEEFENLMDAVTNDVDDGEIGEAMIRIAREADVLPR